GTNQRNPGTQLFEYRRSNVVSGAMSTVEHDIQPMQTDTLGNGRLAELDITTGSIIDPGRLAQRIRRHSGQLFLQSSLDTLFDFISQLGAGSREELDAVVLIGIVRRRYDYPRIGSE